MWPAMSSAAFSASTTTWQVMLPLGLVGIAEASATHKQSVPWTRKSGLSAPVPTGPMEQLPVGW